MATAVKNFAKGTVSTGYGASANSIGLTTGHGSRFEGTTFPYPAVWWNATDYADPSDDPNVEIVSVTARTGDTLTITRAQEGTTATAKNTASKTYKLIAPVTAAMWDALADRSMSQSFRNLHLRTHYDNTYAAYKVVLLHADAIVMDDGEEIRDWDMLEADLTAVGAGGLDTGTEAASVNYGIYAIAANGASKSIMFHREKDYFLDEEVITGEDGAHALRDATARTRLAQGFQVDTAGELEFIDVKLVKTGSPTGNFWVTLEANSGGVPTNTALATTDKYDVSRLQITTPTWVRLPFRTPYSVSAATQYHLVLQGDFTVSGANYISWRADTSAATYANGSKAAYDGATWTTDTDDDFMFKAYITRNETAVTLPTGYTQQALIGFAYNNTSSNLKYFEARDRFIFTGHGDDWQVGAFTNASPPALTHLDQFIPARAVQCHFEGYDGSAANAGLGGLKVTDLVSTTVTEEIGAVKAYIGERGSFAPLVLEYQGVNAVVSVGTMNLYLTGYEW